jgi:hypothetical protein
LTPFIIFKRQTEIRLTRRPRGHAERVNTLAGVLLIVLLAVPLAFVGAFFIWAARKDGAEDDAVQRRLGRRSTRLGP